MEHQGNAASPDDDAGFFVRLSPVKTTDATFDVVNYRSAPDSWLLVVTDIEDSTGAIAAGRHKAVNIVAASSIAALKNLCAPVAIPFLFGGDGAVVMLPGSYASDARLALARLRGLAAREFKLSLRVGLVTVADVRRSGSDVLVGRYQPSPGNDFGVFLGGGVGLLESALKEDPNGPLGMLAAIPDFLDDGEAVDMSGLSCRWNVLRSGRGKMMTLIIHGAAEPREVFAEVMRLSAGGGDARPARPEMLKTSWPPTGFVLEARVNRGRRSLALAVAKVLGETLLARLVFARGRPVGGFDPDRYREEVATNTDFCKHDDTVCFVLDCSVDAIAAVRQFLDRQAAGSGLRYGIHLSDTALMTCLVSSATDNVHVHFIDGGDGGYSTAAGRLKAADPAAT